MGVWTYNNDVLHHEHEAASSLLYTGFKKKSKAKLAASMTIDVPRFLETESLI